MPTVTVRTLKREFRLLAGSTEIAESFAFMAIAPEIAGARLEPVDIAIETVFQFLRLRLPDGAVAEGTPSHLINRLHGMILADVIASESDSPMIHGATLVRNDRRLVLIGDKGCGKSSLALYLLAQGFAVEGDEHVVVRREGVIARPRTMRLKAGSLALVPELAAAVRRSPAIENWDGTPIYAVDPSIVGGPWRIAEGALNAVVFLEANHGGHSVMTAIATNEAFRRAMDQTIVPPAGIGIAVSKLRQLLSSVPAFRLQIGDLPGAARHLCRLTDPPHAALAAYAS